MSAKFAIASINWTNDDDPSLGGDISLEQCLAEMVLAGFSACELNNRFPKNLESIKKITAEYNLKLTTDWIGTKFTKEDNFFESLQMFKEKVSFLKHLGIKALKVCECGSSIQQTSLPILHTKVGFSEKEWQMLFMGLQKIGEIARDEGLFIAYHPHLGTGIENSYQINRLMNETDPDLIFLLPDTGHLYVADINPFEIFETYYKRIKYVHLKDVRQEILSLVKNKEYSFMKAIRSGLFTVPGDGVINFKPIFDLLIKNRFNDWLVVEAEQDPKKANPLVYAKKARKFLRDNFERYL